MSQEPGQNVSSEAREILLVFDFADGAAGWSAGFTDYSLSLAELHLAAGMRPLPSELGVKGHGFYIQGTNVSDDLCMFLTRQVTARDGVKPHCRYSLTCEIEFASNAPTGAVGTGGAPGESVYVKAGGAPVQPTPIIDNDGRVTLNIDKGNQATGGTHAGVAGNVANGRTPAEPPRYVMLTHTYRHPVPISADEHVNLWLFVGTDSGFESQTALYYKKLSFRLVYL